MMEEKMNEETKGSFIRINVTETSQNKLIVSFADDVSL